MVELNRFIKARYYFTSWTPSSRLAGDVPRNLIKTGDMILLIGYGTLDEFETLLFEKYKLTIAKDTYKRISWQLKERESFYGGINLNTNEFVSVYELEFSKDE